MTPIKPQLTFNAEIGKMVGLELNQLSITMTTLPLPQRMRRRKELSLQGPITSLSDTISLQGASELIKLSDTIQAVTLMPHPALLQITTLVKALQEALFVLRRRSSPSLQLGADKLNPEMSMELAIISKTPQGIMSPPELIQLSWQGSICHQEKE